MTRSQLRRQLREQRRALRRQLARDAATVRARLNADPRIRNARRKRRTTQAGLLAVLALLLLFVRCDCGARAGPPPGPLDAGMPRPAPAPKPPPSPAPKPKPLTGTLESKRRGTLVQAPPDGPGWLEAFRLQVAARSPQLARCFTGSDRPGALRWSAAVDTRTGSVADHQLEPMGKSGDLRSAQRACVVKVLSQPPYRLEGAGQTLPTRVSLVLEF